MQIIEPRLLKVLGLLLLRLLPGSVVIQISGDHHVYRAYDIDGKQRDELVIEK